MNHQEIIIWYLLCTWYCARYIFGDCYIKPIIKQITACTISKIASHKPRLIIFPHGWPSFQSSMFITWTFSKGQKQTNKKNRVFFFSFFGLLFLHFLHPCPKSDQSPNPACSPSLASPVPILSYSSPQHIHLGPRYFMMRSLQWDLFSASFSTTSFSSKGPLRPFKLILLIHHFQGLTLSHYIMES